MMEVDAELIEVCEQVVQEGIIQRARATGSAIGNQFKSFFKKTPQQNTPAKEPESGTDGLPGSSSRTTPKPSMWQNIKNRTYNTHEVGVNSKANSLIKQYMSRIQKRSENINKFIADGKKKNMISEKAAEIYDGKIKQIQGILTAFNDILTGKSSPSTPVTPAPSTPSAVPPPPAGSSPS